MLDLTILIGSLYLLEFGVRTHKTSREGLDINEQDFPSYAAFKADAGLFRRQRKVRLIIKRQAQLHMSKFQLRCNIVEEKILWIIFRNKTILVDITIEIAGISYIWLSTTTFG